MSRVLTLNLVSWYSLYPRIDHIALGILVLALFPKANHLRSPGLLDRHILLLNLQYLHPKLHRIHTTKPRLLLLQLDLGPVYNLQFCQGVRWFRRTVAFRCFPLRITQFRKSSNTSSDI